MNDREIDSQLAPEYLVAENLSEAVWLRLRRLTSPTLCSRSILARAPGLDPEIAKKKGQEIASSVRSALGYWQGRAASLNAKVLTRYYALLQISIAEQVADPHETADLRRIQAHTEAGHGLWTISDPNSQFPEGYMVACRDRGHFHEYCRFKGIDLSPFVSKARRNSWSDLSSDAKTRLVSVADLFRRIPELQPLIEETFGVPPLSFQVDSNNTAGFELHDVMGQNLDQARNGPDDGLKKMVSHIGVFSQSNKLTVEYLSSIQLPLANIRTDYDRIEQKQFFVGDLIHPKGKYWYQCLPTYKSGYCPTSIIAPIWGVTDLFVIHFMTLYALSIVVRYLPLLWHEIEDGQLDHLRVLIEQYIAIVDNVLPRIAIERITDRRLVAVHPGSWGGPT